MEKKENSREKVAEIFKRAKNQKIKANPYIKTRVLACIDAELERKRAKKWKFLAVLSPVALSIVFLLFFLFQPYSFKASVGETVVIKVKLEKLTSEEVLYAKIDLPEGVNFFSKRHPELSEKMSLVIAWNESYANGLPVIIKAREKGMKTVKISFFNENEEVIGSKYLKIKFNGTV